LIPAGKSKGKSMQAKIGDKKEELQARGSPVEEATRNRGGLVVLV
jgi:hypothetical protein